MAWRPGRPFRGTAQTRHDLRCSRVPQQSHRRRCDGCESGQSWFLSYRWGGGLWERCANVGCVDRIAQSRGGDILRWARLVAGYNELRRVTGIRALMHGSHAIRLESDQRIDQSVVQNARDASVATDGENVARGPVLIHPRTAKALAGIAGTQGSVAQYNV